MSIDLDTSEKVVSLVAGAIAIGGAVAGAFYYKRRNENDEVSLNQNPMPPAENNSSSTGNTQNLTVNVGTVQPSGSSLPALQPSSLPVAEMKKNTKVLFVDDDQDFKIVGVLRKMGWKDTKLIVDVASLEQKALADAHVVFVDIQGVGRLMEYTDEGLGLVLAIKRRYPDKKVVIYSAVEVGERFHPALQEADYSLPKTAEPIRFEETIVRVLRK